MKTNTTLYKMVFELMGAGVKDRTEAVILGHELLTLRRLAKKHHRLAEMACNGEGWLGGKYYTCAGADYSGLIDRHSAYVKEDVTLFDVESDKVEAKIKAICERLGLRVEFQGDPRGYTVKVYKGDRFLDIQA